MGIYPTWEQMMGTETEGAPEPESENPDPDPTGTEGEDTPPNAEALRAEADKWKALARKHEDRAKAGQAELEKIKRESLPDHEKALADVADKARTEALRGVVGKLAMAEFRSRCAEALIPFDAVEGLAAAAAPTWVTGDGEPDIEAITATVEKLKSFATKPTAPRAPSGPQGGNSHKTDWLGNALLGRN